MSTTPNIFSQAFNFPPVSSSINDRTGAVDIYFPLGSISSGLQSPASFTLALNYRPGSLVSSYGFGGNWIPNTPRIDFTNQIIHLSNGSAEKYTGNFQLQYHRLQDINIERLRLDETAPGGGLLSYYNYIITHKSGVIEYFDEHGRITRLASASGNYLDFTYEVGFGEYPRLLRIQDRNGNYIAIDWNDIPNQSNPQDQIIMVRQVMADETKVTKIYGTAGFGTMLVKGISLPNSESDRYKFEYTGINGLAYITEFTNPNGQLQTFSYGSVSYASNQTIPVVNQVDITGARTGDTHKTTVRYEYSSNNFTGYSPGWSMQPRQDNCILRTDEYTYDVTEKHSDIKIVRTFNRFHLLLSETQSANTVDENSEKRILRFSYPLIPAENINEQRPTYALWVRKETVFQDAAGTQRSIYQEQAFDDSGNLQSERRASGIVNVNTYYPAAGTDGCPADPNGFVKYLKTAYTTGEEHGSSLKTLALRYQSVRGLDYPTPKSGMRSSTMVLPEKTTINGVEVETNGYVASNGNSDAVSRPFIGMPLWKQAASNGQTYKTSFEYTSNNGRATETKKYESVAGAVTLRKQESKTFSLSSGLVQSEIDFNGAVTNYQYDAQGRLTQQTNYVGTDWEQTETIAYESYHFISDSYSYQNVVTTTTPNGMQYIDCFNFNNKPSYSFEALPQADSMLVKSRLYNAAGLLESESSYDRVVSTNNEPQLITTTTSYLYHLRNLTRKTNADGSQDKFSKNAALNTETFQRNAMAITTTTYDDADNVLKIEVSTGNTNTVLARNTYDGFGRKTQSVDATGGVTRYRYDIFDRLTTETVENTDGNGRIDTNSYVYSSVVQCMTLPISVTSKTTLNNVEDTILSETRMYDGFGRLIKQGDLEFTYANSYDERPLTSGVADAVITETVDPTTLLPSTVARRGPGDNGMDFSYSYERPSGRMTQATSSQNNVQQVQFQYTYNGRGQVSNLTSTYHDNGAVVSLEKTFSASGERLLSASNHLGKTQRYYYSTVSSRLIMKTCDDINIHIAYHDEGNIYSIELRSIKFGGAQEPLRFKVYFQYNDYGLEIARLARFITLSEGAHDILDVTNHYTESGTLTSRTIIKDGSSRSPVNQRYSYQAAYGHLKTSNTSVGTSDGVLTSYDFSGGLRLNTVTEGEQTPITYTYINDVPSRLSDGVTTTEFNRDLKGNITNSPLPGKSLNFDAANSLVKCELDGPRTYQYLYEPSGQLSRIKSDAGDSIIYLYDEGKLIGEMSGDTKTLYLTVGDIMIGRYILRGSTEELELYGTDSSGSVRYVKRLAVGGSELSTNYFDYSDYGVQTPG